MCWWAVSYTHLRAHETRGVVVEAVVRVEEVKISRKEQDCVAKEEEEEEVVVMVEVEIFGGNLGAVFRESRGNGGAVRLTRKSRMTFVCSVSPLGRHLVLPPNPNALSLSLSLSLSLADAW